ncbi:hypothetical protein FRC12_001562, partial [Ceratobasidium sp. 428]
MEVQTRRTSGGMIDLFARRGRRCPALSQRGAGRAETEGSRSYRLYDNPVLRRKRSRLFQRPGSLAWNMSRLGALSEWFADERLNFGFHAVRNCRSMALVGWTSKL